MDKSAPIFVAGHRGLIGSACVRLFMREGFSNVLTRTHAELDLADERVVSAFFAEVEPTVVILAAGKVGGIQQNKSHPADFMTENLQIQTSVLKSVFRHGVERLVFFGSSCMYPRECLQPMSEQLLFTGKLEATSLAYAVAKLAGVQMCLAYNEQYGEKRFIPVIPNSTYGPFDNFDPGSSHVLSALIRRFHEAKQSEAPEVVLWGTGTPRRELIHADDVADAVYFLLQRDTDHCDFPVNIGTGVDYSVAELAQLVARIVGYSGMIGWDKTRPDGAPQKLLDNSRLLKMGWRPRVALESGIRQTYEWFLSCQQRVCA